MVSRYASYRSWLPDFFVCLRPTLLLLLLLLLLHLLLLLLLLLLLSWLQSMHKYILLQQQKKIKKKLRVGGKEPFFCNYNKYSYWLFCCGQLGLPLVDLRPFVRPTVRPSLSNSLLICVLKTARYEASRKAVTLAAAATENGFSLAYISFNVYFLCLATTKLPLLPLSSVKKSWDLLPPTGRAYSSRRKKEMIMKKKKSSKWGDNNSNNNSNNNGMVAAVAAAAAATTAAVRPPHIFFQKFKNPGWLSLGRREGAW